MIEKVLHPFGKYNGKEYEYVLKALDTQTEDGHAGSWVQRFEEAFAEKVGAKYAIAVNSGTSGLHAALYAAGVGPGNEVIQPGMTVVMDAYATLHLGAVPIFIDIVESTHHIDHKSIESKITDKTKAIVVVSWQGLPVDMDPIMDIAYRYGLIVVEDSAQTMLGRYKGRIAGTIGHIGVFSFENKKHLTSGSEGGIIVTNNEDYATLARKFAGIGYKHMTSTAGRTHLALSTVQDPSYIRFDTIGLNYRMNDVSAAIGLAQLERVEHIVERRIACARLFSAAISGCEWMIPQYVGDGIEHSYYTFAVDYRGESMRGVAWKDFYNRYVSAGGDGFYACVQPPYLELSLIGKKYAGYMMSSGLCPKSESLQHRLMQFKTNYRDLGEARFKADVLSKLIDEIGR